jgi:hypothetical protein
MESSLDDPNFENPLSDEIGNLKDQVEKVEERIDDTISTVKTEIKTLGTDEDDTLQNPVDVQVEDEPPSFFETIFGGILAEPDVIDTEPDVIDTEPDVDVESEQETNVIDTDVKETLQTPSDGSNNNSVQLFQTLSLTTTKLDDGTISLRYDDTSGGTQSVSVTLRNSEKILFSGEFFSSKFETLVVDPSGTPHFIDMVVNHEEYGTITSSVFNPAGQTDTTINGVFTES